MLYDSVYGMTGVSTGPAFVRYLRESILEIPKEHIHRFCKHQLRQCKTRMNYYELKVRNKFDRRIYPDCSFYSPQTVSALQLCITLYTKFVCSAIVAFHRQPDIPIEHQISQRCRYFNLPCAHASALACAVYTIHLSIHPMLAAKIPKRM